MSLSEKHLLPCNLEMKGSPDSALVSSLLPRAPVTPTEAAAQAAVERGGPAAARWPLTTGRRFSLSPKAILGPHLQLSPSVTHVRKVSADSRCDGRCSGVHTNNQDSLPEAEVGSLLPHQLICKSHISHTTPFSPLKGSRGWLAHTW